MKAKAKGTARPGKNVAQMAELEPGYPGYRARRMAISPDQQSGRSWRSGNLGGSTNTGHHRPTRSMARCARKTLSVRHPCLAGWQDHRTRSGGGLGAVEYRPAYLGRGTCRTCLSETETRAARGLVVVVHAKFFQVLAARCKRDGIDLAKVDPAFTSVIGRTKYARGRAMGTRHAAALGHRPCGTGIWRTPRHYGWHRP